MKKAVVPINKLLIALLSAAVLLPTIAAPLPALTEVVLQDARFDGLTRIVVTTNVPLDGISPAQVAITRPDGTVIPPAQITGIQAAGNTLSVILSAEPFARISSQGTSIATRSFGAFKAARPIKILKRGEPAANGHILGSSAWTDEGWNTSKTDPAFLDPATGQAGLYRFTDLTPNRDEKGRPLIWNNGSVTAPAHRVKNMLVLFVEFPDRRAADAGDPYTMIPPYIEFLRGAEKWFDESSYGQLRFRFISPQSERQLGWIMMGKNAAQYKWDGQTHNMFAYVREACQRAYDSWRVRADDYDMLLVMPARGKLGLFNGPGNINRDPTDGEQPNTSLVAYVDREGKSHYVDTALTAGNDLFRWGYRWVIHESGHAFGFPDLYMYAPTVNGVRVGAFFYCGGWDMMGNIGGHSTDYLAWHKWKLRWIRDDQVEVVSQTSTSPAIFALSPVETPGGSKMVVIRTGLATAYVAEFRTRLGINGLDGRGKYSGILIYRIDASRWEARGTNPTAQIISRQYYSSATVGGAKNLTGIWRPIDSTLDGYDSPGCCWQPGDVFSDPVMGVTIRVDAISHYDSTNPSNSAYTENDVATVRVAKNKDAELFQPVVLSNARLKNLTALTVDTSVELQLRIANANAGNGGTYTYTREGTAIAASHLIIRKAGGALVPANKIVRISIKPTGIEVALAAGAFAGASDAAGATVATRPFYHFGAGAAVRVSVSE